MSTVKCGYCGKFISHDDLFYKKAKFVFTPDSALSKEEGYWICKKCRDKEKK